MLRKPGSMTDKWDDGGGPGVSCYQRPSIHIASVLCASSSDDGRCRALVAAKLDAQVREEAAILRLGQKRQSSAIMHKGET